LASAFEVAEVVDEHARFERAAERYQACCRRWPRLQGVGCVAGHFDAFADYSHEDFQRLVELVAWLVEHPDSGYYLRQLPIPGMDTKWIQRGRGKLIAALVGTLRDKPAADFHTATGIRRPPQRLRMRVLCPALRCATVGLTDVEAPVAELAGIRVAPACVVIVENLETGLALPDLPGCIAFMKLGHAVSILKDVPWLRGARVVYWGDIDTHGLAILDRARGTLGHVSSALMDEATLLAHRDLWTEEPAQHPATELAHLTVSERRLFDALSDHRWGHKVRLEQERVRWSHALEAISRASAGKGHGGSRGVA